MSVKVTSMVWEKSNARGPHRLVLLALADFSDDTGCCWPSIPTVARKCAISDRTAQRCIQDLRAMGELEVSESAGKRVNGGATNRFRIIKGGDKDDTTPPDKADTGRQSVTGCQIVHGGDKADTGGGVTGDAKVVTRLTPEPSVEPSLLPSIEPPLVKTSKKEESPAEVFKSRWNALPPPFKPIRSMSAGRTKHLRQRMSEKDWASDWQEALSKMPRSPFLTGRNDRGWIADADFFLRPDSVAKILEGKYDHSSNGSQLIDPTR